MTATNLTGRPLPASPVRKLSLAAGLLGWILLVPLAQAENVLKDVRVNASATGGVEISLDFEAAPGEPQVFTTDDPPRIAVDLADTRNAVAQRRQTIGSGAASAVTALEAGGKTRVVVDLFRPASYETRRAGNSWVLKIADGGSGAAKQAAMASADPAKQMPGGTHVSNVDFRRNEAGGGRVILSFNAENVPSDLTEQDDNVVITFDGVGVPDALSQRLDVADFATPVRSIELTRGQASARLRIAVSGRYETMAYQTGSEYVLEVNPLSDEAADELGVGLAAAEKVYSGTPVTFNFQNIPVRTVLQLIAEESGLNVVAADTVAGNVTLRLVNVPWDQALEIVLRAKGLDQRRDGNVVWVAPQTELAAYEQALADARLALEERAELISEYIPINYGSAEELAKLFTDDAKRSSGGAAAPGSQQQNSGFLSPRGSVTFDRRTNTLLISETADKLKELKALIALLDRPVDQVLIEARIVVASENFARELGARFGISGAYEDSNGNVLSSSGSSTSADRMTNAALVNRFSGQSSGLPVGAPGPIGGGTLVPNAFDRLNVNLPVIAPSGSIGFALLGADYLLDLELSALETEGRGEVVSSPRVITANQREAVIRQGDEVGYVTISGAGGSGGIPIPTVEFKPVLLELTVTPTITQDNRVYLVMKIIKDEVAGFVDTSIGSVPQISKREISTAVLMQNSQTVVIGGVYEFSSREDLNKVPFLGDVPVLGNLFRKKGKETEKAELLVFVTPRVVPVAGKK